MTRPIYLYAVEWDDVEPTRSTRRGALIAGGCQSARDARRLAVHSFRSERFLANRKVRGVPVIRRVRRLGVDTPANRENVYGLRIQAIHRDVASDRARREARG